MAAAKVLDRLDREGPTTDLLSPAGPVPAPGRTLRGYELAERIGKGSFGVVYRAHQTAVGREVALKAIRPELADQPEFVRRFELEAQLVARLEHAHIVPLYDYWREPGGAYLVMRLLRGGSAKQVLERDGPLEPDAAVRLLSQVGDGLDAAHRHGVVHRDLKPANLLLDGAGSAYLSDFGIAKELAAASDLTRTGTVPGVPAYVSPEQVRGEPVTPLADLYALGIVAFELLTGAHPYAGEEVAGLLFRHLHDPLPPLRELRPGLPDALDAVLERATAKRPADRYPDAPALLAALRDALGSGAAAIEVRPMRRATLLNPYKGLRPFSEADAADFFGREALTARLVERLRDSHFLAVVGPSGSGKSSLIRAGLVPAMRGGALPGSQTWFVAEMVPGSDPFDELKAALRRVAVRLPDDLADRLAADPAGPAAVADELLPQPGADLLLVVDQLEELFTLVEDEDLRHRFLEALVATATSPTSRLRVVVTLRADFYDRPLLHPGFGELVRAGTETVLPLSSDELERAVSRPAERVGVVLEPGLLAEVAAEVADQPGALPLLQYALTELFDHRQGHILTLASYRELGGVSGALARRADDLYQDLDDQGRRVARQVLLRLVTLGEGTEDTRRRVPRSELAGLASASGHADMILDRFGAARLLSFDRDPDTRMPTVEVAHEALLREWGRLRRWIDDARDDLRSHRRLAQAAADWTQADNDPGLVLRGTRLAQLEAWAAETDLELTPAERGYLDASLQTRRREEEEEAARQAREASLERRSLRRLRALLAVLGVATMVAAGLSVFAFSQSRRAEAQADLARSEAERAEEQARIAIARELAAAAVANLDVDTDRSILLALEAVETTRSVGGGVLREAEEALHRAVGASRVLVVLRNAGVAAQFSPDGTTFVTEPEGSSPPAVWDAATGVRLATLTGHAGDVNDVAYLYDAEVHSAVGGVVITAGDDGTLRAWQAESGRIFVSLQFDSPVRGLSTSPDGRTFAFTRDDGTLAVFDALEPGRSPAVTGYYDEVLTVEGLGFPEQPPQATAFSPDGTRVAAGLMATGDARVWDLASGKQVLTLEGHEFGVTDVVFTPDGTRLVTTSFDSTAKVWDADSGEELFTLFGHTGPVLAVDVNPDGTHVITASLDGTAKVWELAPTGAQEVLTLPGHSRAVTGVAFSPDGTRVITGDLDETIRIWDVTFEGGKEWLVLPADQVWVGDVAFSPDGRRLVSSGRDGVVHVWDADSGQEVLALRGHGPSADPSGAAVFGIAVHPGGSLVASAGNDNTARVWDATSGRQLFVVRHDGWVNGVAWSPDGPRLATASDDATVRLVDAGTGGEELELRQPHRSGGLTVRIDPETGAEELELEVHTAGLLAVEFSPDGTRLAIAGQDATAGIWDADTGERLHLLRGHRPRSPVADLSFSPDGTRLATAGHDMTVRVWDAERGGRELLALRGHSGPIEGVAFGPGGTRIATAGHDGTVRLWDAATGDELLVLDGHTDLVARVAFSPDGSRLASISPDGTVRVWALDIKDLVRIARDRASRDLTDEECRTYLHVERCPTG